MQFYFHQFYKLKKNKVCVIRNLNRFFDADEFFDLDEMLEESKKLKYKDSCFFMAIYNNKKNNESLEKTEFL